MYMSIFAFALLMCGLSLVLGPTLIRWFLIGTASITPVSAETVGVGIFLLLAISGTFVFYRRSARVRSRARRILSRLMTIECSVAVFLSVVVLLHYQLVWLRDLWIGLMRNHGWVFTTLTILGIVMILCPICYFVGYSYSKNNYLKIQRKRYDDFKRRCKQREEAERRKSYEPERPASKVVVAIPLRQHEYHTDALSDVSTETATTAKLEASVHWNDLDVPPLPKEAKSKLG